MMADGQSAICTCDCLDCFTRGYHTLHNDAAGLVPPTERDPVTPALEAEKAAPIPELELRAMWGDR